MHAVHYTRYNNAAVSSSSLHGAISCICKSKDVRLPLVHLPAPVIIHKFLLIDSQLLVRIDGYHHFTWEEVEVGGWRGGGGGGEKGGEGVERGGGGGGGRKEKEGEGEGWGEYIHRRHMYTVYTPPQENFS